MRETELYCAVCGRPVWQEPVLDRHGRVLRPRMFCLTVGCDPEGPVVDGTGRTVVR
jgi:hypothetical protein